MIFGQRSAVVGILAVLTALSGCVAPPQFGAPQTPNAQPASTPAGASAKSRALVSYYARMQARFLAQGLLRTDGGGPDTPYTSRDLARNFEQIALYDEYATRSGRFVKQQTPSHLRRWNAPVRMQLIFGASVTPERRSTDTAILKAYTTRLARLTRHSVSLVANGGNFYVLVMNADEAHAFAPKLASLIPGIGRKTINEIANLPRSTYCVAYALSSADKRGPYIAAVATIRAEHPPLMEKACFHEELAQGLGLTNDSPDARPSIFNDDQEFALLTTQDALMLRMLYDRRLKLGMTIKQADPIVRKIAAELMGGQS